MTRILGHLPGILERFEARMATFLDLPQQNSRAVRGIKPVLTSTPQNSVPRDSRVTRMSSRIATSLPPYIRTSRAPFLPVVSALDAEFALGCAPAAAAAHYTAVQTRMCS